MNNEKTLRDEFAMAALTGIISNDRLVSEIAGPTAFARSADDGATWSAARTIYDPGATNQTISNQIKAPKT